MTASERHVGALKRVMEMRRFVVMEKIYPNERRRRLIANCDCFVAGAGLQKSGFTQFLPVSG